MSKTTILIVEDDAGLREALLDTLLLGNYNVVEADCAEQALMMLSMQAIDLVVSDIQMGEMSGLTLLKSIKAKYPNMPVLLMTAYATVNDAVQAMRDGATDYLSKPFAPEVLLNLVGRYAPAQKIESRTPIVADPSSLKLLELSRKVAKSEATVMVMGPSGSGKEVLSRYIHDQSPRSDAPFVAINCAAIPENMLEATLFGYEKGAFTGAIQACPGKFEQAQDGTLLLDEITEMDLALQAKLLRVLQEREVERLGGRKTVKLNVRVIATSNRDLKKAVEAGEFREDLYYRLNVFPIEWRPLSERPGDIVPLAEHLVQRHASSQGLGSIRLSAAARNKLSQYGWPGNVRELENVVQRALILCENNEIDASDLMIDEDISAPVEAVQEQADENRLGSELRYQEHQIILDTLVSCNGKRKDVAEKLGISPRTLRYKLARMREDGIEVPA
ncbi:sigma-54-dependent transcriptional regulator [Alteromonas mediterranea]|uniref:Fis family transcriptional regulator n=1 Tax=Alteromonas mediterranea (strain DSM 17117 / CIP 110805 / LMG 28347 / Deep ecotype) TaxID=1774373 RepID=F2G3X8_ALTMD|nr:sigma-54 dependent transcriptional regulator [Alteromonas mediterranea]AEA97320.1 Fis family transcriptional regulator [Alteromonas mediterranea DE]MEA3381890.1 sigma-54 dependent transcriptional regulator [Pseudomonadota bacterium]CAH1198552.1 Regulatory protein AtoC [Alteromonas mediterranea]|tara:strand:- start:4278 stop:5615 length:1338 start_codon:yes stop_codon:yes gene_type:complete